MRVLKNDSSENESSENKGFKYSEYIFHLTDIIKYLSLALDSDERYS